jgi:hypothetical protein
MERRTIMAAEKTKLAALARKAGAALLVLSRRLPTAVAPSGWGL